MRLQTLGSERLFFVAGPSQRLAPPAQSVPFGGQPVEGVVWGFLCPFEAAQTRPEELISIKLARK